MFMQRVAKKQLNKNVMFFELAPNKPSSAVWEVKIQPAVSGCAIVVSTANTSRCMELVSALCPHFQNNFLAVA